MIIFILWGDRIVQSLLFGVENKFFEIFEGGNKFSKASTLLFVRLLLSINSSNNCINFSLSND